MGVKVGTFLGGATTGFQTVTHGLGETPKLLLIWTSRSPNPSPSSAPDYWFGFGATDGTGSICLGVNRRHNQSPSSTNPVCTSVVSNQVIIWLVAGGGSELQAGFYSWNATTFTIRWIASNGVSANFVYLVVGGANIEARTLTWYSLPGTGTQFVPVGFQPQFALLIPTGLTQMDTISTDVIYHGLGWYDGTTQGATGVLLSSTGPASTSITSSTNIVVLPNILGQAPSMAAVATAFAASGMDLNWTSNLLGSRIMLGVFLRGLAAHKVGSQLGLGTSGTLSVSGLGFSPNAVMLFASVQDSSTSVADARLSLGAGAGATQAVVSEFSAHSSPTNCFRYWESGAIYHRLTTTGGTADRAILQSLDADGFTLNYTAADNVQERLFYWALRAPITRTVSLGGALGSAGTVQLNARRAHVVGGTLSSAGSPTLLRARAIALTGVAGPTGSLVRGIRKNLSGTLAPSGFVACTRLAFVTLAGALAPIGVLINQAIYRKVMSGAITAAGAIAKTVAKAFGGAIASSGVLRLLRTAWRGARRLRAVVADAFGNVIGHILP